MSLIDKVVTFSIVDCYLMLKIVFRPHFSRIHHFQQIGKEKRSVLCMGLAAGLSSLNISFKRKKMIHCCRMYNNFESLLPATVVKIFNSCVFVYLYKDLDLKVLHNSTTPIQLSVDSRVTYIRSYIDACKYVTFSVKGYLPILLSHVFGKLCQAAWCTLALLKFRMLCFSIRNC